MPRALRSICWFALATMALVLRASISAGQTVSDSTGAIEGTVTDPSGLIVAGATICASGPSMMRRETCVDSDSGGFRFPALLPGPYVLTVTLQGFEPGRSDSLQVRIGRTTSAPFKLDVAVQPAVVNVEGHARDLDRFDTTLGDSLTAEQLRSLPGPRSMGAILAATSAILMNGHDVGGNTALSVPLFGSYGFFAATDSRLEGISVTSLIPFGVTLDYGTFGDVWVGRGAYGPDWMTPGVHLQIVTRSGGDQYRGTVYAAMEDERWQARNIDGDQITRGAARGRGVPEEANRLGGYHDLNADIGGFIRRNRVWIYGSGRDQEVAPWRVTFPVAPIETRARSVTAKVTASVIDSHRLVLFAQRSVSRQPVRLDAFLPSLSARTALNLSRDSTTSQTARGLVWKAEWSGDLEGRLFFEARSGQFLARRAESPNGADPDSIRFEDTGSLIVTGRNREWSTELRRDQIVATLSYPAGTHLIRAGTDIRRLVSAEEWTQGYAGDVLHVLNNGIPTDVYLFQTPSRSESGEWSYAGHVSDSWRVTGRLTLNPGLRVDRFRTFLPAQAHPIGRFTPEATLFPAVDTVIAWNVFAPRIGASHALDSSGRTLIKAAYSLYWLPPGPQFGFNANPNSPDWYTQHRWLDVNSNGAWDPGEEGTVRERRGGAPLELVDPEFRLPYVHELTARIEREAAWGFVVTAGLVWRGERQQGVREPAGRSFDAFTEPAPRIDPGMDGLVGTEDDGPEILLYDLPDGFAGSGEMVVRNVERSNSDFTTLEFTAERPIRQRWSLSASFAHTWSRDHASTYGGQTIRANEFPLTPNDLINTDSQGRHVFRVWMLKASATYEAPFAIIVTPFLRHQSGQPSARTFLASLRSGSFRVLAEPIGSRRQDNITLFDFRAARTFRLSGRTRVTGFVEVFNALNTNAEPNVSWSSGRTFLSPLNIVPPRIARLGMELDW
jgi:Carboxypeptidase regulatory-like domain/TonB dependent receptor